MIFSYESSEIFPYVEELKPNEMFGIPFFMMYCLRKALMVLSADGQTCYDCGSLERNKSQFE